MVFAMGHARSIASAVLLAMILAPAGGGCASDGPSSDGLSERDTEGLRASERTVRVSGATPRSGTVATESPALVIGSETMTIGQVAPYLGEAAGAQVIEELLVTRTAERQLVSAGLALTMQDLESERAELMSALASGGSGDPDLLIDSVRRARGLGDARFGLLVRRTAALRKLIASEVSVTEEEIALAHRVRYGEKYRVRLLLTATERDAATALAELSALEGGSRRARFIELAMDRSIDASASAGGLLEPISPADPAYPMIVRTSLPGLTPGALGPVLALNPNYAVVLMEEVIADQGVGLDTVRESLRTDLRRRQERILMDRRAQSILDATPVTVLDPSLQWSWRTRRARSEN